MLIVQKKRSDIYIWEDATRKETVDEAKDYIERQIEDENENPSNYRIVDEVAQCKVKISWNDFRESEQQEESKIPYRATDDRQLLLDFLRKTCELRRFPKTQELDEDPDISNYSIYYANLGSKSNIADMIIRKLKKDEIADDFQGIIEKNLCGDCEGGCPFEKPKNCLLDEITEGGGDE